MLNLGRQEKNNVFLQKNYRVTFCGCFGFCRLCDYCSNRTLTYYSLLKPFLTMESKNRLLLLALLSLLGVTAWASSFTSITLRIDAGGRMMSIPLPATGFSTVDMSGTAMPSVVLDGYSAVTSGTVQNVYLYGALYQEGTSPNEWHQVPSMPGGDNTWSISGLDIDFVQEMSPGKVYYIEAYFEGVTDKGEKFYYNNGGSNYKVKVLAGGESEPLRFLDGNTASVMLNVDGSTREYTFSGNGSRNPSDQVGQLSKLSIEGFEVEFMRQSGLEISSVSLQYKVYGEGEDGSWNGLEASSQQDVGGDKLHKSFYSYGIGQSIDVSMLDKGRTYVLELMFQVVTGGGKYYFFGRGSDAMRFKFSVADDEDPMKKKFDLNEDGGVDVGDVNLLLDYILNH